MLGWSRGIDGDETNFICAWQVSVVPVSAEEQLDYDGWIWQHSKTFTSLGASFFSFCLNSFLQDLAGFRS